MEKVNFEEYMDHFKQSFKSVNEDITGIVFEELTPSEIQSKSKISVIIGITGKYKGRITLEADLNTSEKITEIMNMEPLKNKIDLMMYIAEYTNIISGKAISSINDRYRGYNLRLSPFAVFSGDYMQLLTPKVQSAKAVFNCSYGKVVIDVGFEGM